MLARIPEPKPGEPGHDADPALIDEAVSKAVEQIPDMVRLAVGQAVAEIGLPTVDQTAIVRDVLAHMGFRPQIEGPVRMDARIFRTSS